MEFDTDDKGGIISFPLYGWTTVPAMGMALITRLEYFPTPLSMANRSPEAVQLTWTPQQCREFGQLLLKMADHLSQPPKTGVPS